MTFLQALEVGWNDPNLWFRPVDWVGCGEAFGVEQESGAIVRLPSPHGGTRTTISAPAMLSEWELVTPDKVLKERHGKLPSL